MTNGEDIREFILNKPLMGFIPGHQYILEIEWNGCSAYDVCGIYDVTEDKSIDLFINLSSNNSIDRYFKKIERKE